LLYITSFFRSAAPQVETDDKAASVKPGAVVKEEPLAPITGESHNVPKKKGNQGPTDVVAPKTPAKVEPIGENLPGPTGQTVDPETTMTPKELVDSRLNNNKVVIFSKSYCPFCKAAKKVFADKKVETSVYEVDQAGDHGKKNS